MKFSKRVRAKFNPVLETEFLIDNFAQFISSLYLYLKNLLVVQLLLLVLNMHEIRS